MDSVSPDPDAPVPALKVLEPSPVDETPAGTESEYFPPQGRRAALGLTSHHLPYYLLRAQKYSSITFTLFAAMHMTNTSLIPLVAPSLSAANSYLLLTRPYYQSALAEPLLVAIPLATHIVAGIALRLHRRHAAAARYTDKSAPRSSLSPSSSSSTSASASFWPPLSWPAALGYAAVPLVLGHAALTRALPRAVEGSSAGVGLDYVGHGVALAPWAGLAGFGALVAVVSAHAMWGIARWAGWTPATAGGVGAERRLDAKRRWWVLQGASFGVALVWAAGGLGVVARGGRVPGWVGRGYDAMLGKVPVLKWAL